VTALARILAGRSVIIGGRKWHSLASPTASSAFTVWDLKAVAGAVDLPGLEASNN